MQKSKNSEQTLKKYSGWNTPEVVKENELRSKPIPSGVLQSLKGWFQEEFRNKLEIIGEDN